MPNVEKGSLPDINGTLENMLNKLQQAISLSETIEKEDVEKILNIAKIAVDELKDLTLRYVRRMRLIPYPDHDYNSYPFICRVIIQELFAYAQENPEEKVKIFTGDVKAEFYGDGWLFKEIRELAVKGVKFDIILAKPPTGDCLSSWQQLVKECPGEISVRMHKTYSNRLQHLMLVGDSYRIEAPHDDYGGDVTELAPKRPARYGFHESSFVMSDVQFHWENEIDIPAAELIPAV